MPAVFGIMQGRLSPPEDGRFQSFPRKSWREEIARARKLGSATLNGFMTIMAPLSTRLLPNEGIAELNGAQEAEWNRDTRHLRGLADGFSARALLGRTTGTSGKSCFMTCCAGRKESKLRGWCFRSSMLRRFGLRSEKNIVLRVLERALPLSEEAGVELHLEADFGPADFASFLARIPHASVKVNYDTGNSSGLGYVASEEFAAYGDRIGSIHIKDRLRLPDGGIVTKPLGQGSANFEDVFASIRRGWLFRRVYLTGCTR